MSASPPSGTQPAPRLPDFLVIGVGKSGTTSLAAYLDAHPGVFMAHGKEVRFFDRYYDRGPNWYAAQFAAAGERRAGEASPTYFGSEAAPARVAELLPGVPKVLMLRNPVDVLYSAWANAHSARQDPRTFGEAIDQELEEGGPPPAVSSRYLESGRYADHLDRWRAADPAAPIHREWFEDLTTDPRSLFSRVCAFIGADPEVVPANVGRVYHRSHRFRFEWWRSAMLRWRVWDRLPYRTAYWISSLNRVERVLEPMDPAVRARLLDYFAPHNDRLQTLLGEPLPETWRH